MTSIVSNPPAPFKSSVEFLALPLFLALIWGQLFWALHPTWLHGQYYDYGWIVAPISTWFFWRNWQDTRDAGVRLPGKWKVLLLAVVGFLVFVLLVLCRILERFDSIWRVPLLFHGLLVLVATLVSLGLVKGFRTSLVFVPTVLFAMTAVPWPTQIENLIIGEMTERLLAVAAPLARLVGIPVELSGATLIAPDGRVIQIDEGCSGIRSFQSLIMTSLFVGEFLKLSLRFRLIILVLGFVFGFLTNTLRAVTLAWIFFNKGEIAFKAYHDLVGIMAFALAAGLLLLTGHLTSVTKMNKASAP